MGLSLKVDIAVFGDDQADFAVFCPLPVVVIGCVSDAIVLVYLCGCHGGHHQTIGQSQVTDGKIISISTSCSRA